jgi:NADPH:quinone reductase-like Zn-dependent oxidoreductase
MRKIVYHDYGDPADVLKQVDVPSPTPARGEVFITITARPVHSGDLLAITGHHDPDRTRIPVDGFTPGYEGVGVIARVGPGVDPGLGLVPGTRVAFFAIGTWQDEISIPAESVVKVPPEIDDDVAAQIHVNPIAALLLTRQLLESKRHVPTVLRLSAVETSTADAVLTNPDAQSDQPDVVLLSAAGSIVAKLIAAILRDNGFDTVGLVRSAERAAELHDATGISAISTATADWWSQVDTATRGRNVVFALDAVGGEIGSALLELVSPGGTLVSYGSLSGQPLEVEQVHLWMAAKAVRGFGMIHWTELPAEVRAKDVAAAMELARRYRDLIPTAAAFDLSQATEAAQYFTQPGRDGAVLLRESAMVDRSGG